MLGRCEAGACQAARSALAGRSIHGYQLGNDAARRKRTSVRAVAGAPSVSSMGRGSLRAMVVDRLEVALVLGAAVSVAVGAVHSPSALPDGDRRGGFLRCDRDGAAWLVRKLFRRSRFGALGNHQRFESRSIA